MRVNIFIRKENEDKWKSIPNKSEWINAILNNADDTSHWGETKETPAGTMVEVLSEKIASPTANRSLSDILNDIRAQELERDEKLEWNQDPLEAKSITTEYAEKIQLLWDEYHATKSMLQM